MVIFHRVEIKRHQAALLDVRGVERAVTGRFKLRAFDYHLYLPSAAFPETKDSIRGTSMTGVASARLWISDK